jgi:hypothetical protein
MPNQRAKDKVYLGGFIEKRLMKEISVLARKAHMEHNRFGFVIQLIQGPVERRRLQRKKGGSGAPQFRVLPLQKPVRSGKRSAVVQHAKAGKKLRSAKERPMRRGIQDEFSSLNVSRQRRYQLRKQRDNLCVLCGEPAVRGSRCLRHLIAARERQRKRAGTRGRYVNAQSYKLAASKRES